MKNKQKWHGLRRAVTCARRCKRYWRIFANEKTREVWCNLYNTRYGGTIYFTYDVLEIANGRGKITKKELYRKLEEV